MVTSKLGGGWLHASRLRCREKLVDWLLAGRHASLKLGCWILADWKTVDTNWLKTSNLKLANLELANCE